MRVLVVDDNESLSFVTACTLQELGYEASTASGGKDALSMILSGETYDVVITDYHMPGMTGKELMRSLRSHGFVGKIIGMSGGLTEPFCNPFLVKPFSERALLKALEE